MATRPRGLGRVLPPEPSFGRHRHARAERSLAAEGSRMHAIRTIRVVLGEGHPGLLRLVLEAQGFEVIGHAHDDEELLRILDLTSPSVVVLDAGISAIAAAEAAIRSGDAAIVLVWPRDVVTSIAAERVEPASAILEIGNAVRRASERRPAEEVIRVPEASTPTDPIDVASEPTSPEPSPPGSASPGRARRATRHVLVAVAAWVLSITALGAHGVTRGLEPGPGDETRVRPRP